MFNAGCLRPASVQPHPCAARPRRRHAFMAGRMPVPAARGIERADPETARAARPRRAPPIPNGAKS
jgi:hypothetical protein